MPLCKSPFGSMNLAKNTFNSKLSNWLAEMDGLAGRMQVDEGPLVDKETCSSSAQRSPEEHQRVSSPIQSIL